MGTETTKDKLLNVLGDFAMDELSVDGLLEVLAARLKSQEQTIDNLRRENGSERAKLHEDREILYREIMDVRRNPNLLIDLQAYFKCQDGRTIEVMMRTGQLMAFEAIGKDKVKYAMQAISSKEAWS